MIAVAPHRQLFLSASHSIVRMNSALCLGFALVVMACTSNRPMERRGSLLLHGLDGSQTVVPGTDETVNVVWIWTRCLKAVEGLVAVETLYRRYQVNSHVTVRAVLVEPEDPARIRELLARRDLTLPVYLDPDCRVCQLLPKGYWDEMRRDMRAAGVPEEELADIETEPGIPTLLVMDAQGRAFYMEGFPLGMSVAQLAAEIDTIVGLALRGHLADAKQPQVDWDHLVGADRERAIGIAREQLVRWQKISTEEMDRILENLGSRGPEDHSP
jgi:hypothetical protein